jgi:PKD repeat protein
MKPDSSSTVRRRVLSVAFALVLVSGCTSRPLDDSGGQNDVLGPADTPTTLAVVAGESVVAGTAMANTPDGPLATFEVSTTIGPAPLSVWLGAKGSTSRTDHIAAYDWDFGDAASSTAVELYHTFSTAGAFPVRLTVTDGSGRTGTASLTIVALPSISIAADPDVSVGTPPLTVTLRAQSDVPLPELPAGLEYEYQWDFGDGEVGAGGEVQHVFSRAGAFSVKLAVVVNPFRAPCATRQFAVETAAYVDEDDTTGDTTDDGTGADDGDTDTPPGDSDTDPALEDPPSDANDVVPMFDALLPDVGPQTIYLATDRTSALAWVTDLASKSPEQIAVLQSRYRIMMFTGLADGPPDDWFLSNLTTLRQAGFVTVPVFMTLTTTHTFEDWFDQTTWQTLADNLSHFLARGFETGDALPFCIDLEPYFTPLAPGDPLYSQSLYGRFPAPERVPQCLEAMAPMLNLLSARQFGFFPGEVWVAPFPQTMQACPGALALCEYSYGANLGDPVDTLADLDYYASLYAQLGRSHCFGFYPQLILNPNYNALLGQLGEREQSIFIFVNNIGGIYDHIFDSP